MGADKHTRGYGRLSLGLSAVTAISLGACSFDSAVEVSPQDPGATLPAADAGPVSPDADRMLAPDAQPQPDAAPTQVVGTLGASPLTGELTLDGELDLQWQALEFRVFSMSDAEQYESVAAYQADASVSFASLYDANNLYFFFQITDDNLVQDSSEIYNDDSIEIYIDGLGDAAGPYASDDHWIVVGADATYQSLGPGNIPILGSIIETSIGYNVEISIARSALGAGAASELGFNLGLNDDDGAGNSGVDAYGLWFLPQTEACASCCTNAGDKYAWCDTTRLGRLQLLP